MASRRGGTAPRARRPPRPPAAPAGRLAPRAGRGRGGGPGAAAAVAGVPHAGGGGGGGGGSPRGRLGVTHNRARPRVAPAEDVGERPLVVAVGRLVAQKNHRRLLDAIALVPEAHLLIV